MPSRAGHLGNEGMKSQTQQTSSSLAGLGAVFRKRPDMGLEYLFRAAIFFIWVPSLPLTQEEPEEDVYTDSLSGGANPLYLTG